MARLGILLLGVIGLVFMAACDLGLLFYASKVSEAELVFKALARGVPAIGILGSVGGGAIAYARSGNIWTAVKTFVALCFAADLLLFLMVAALGPF